MAFQEAPPVADDELPMQFLPESDEQTKSPESVLPWKILVVDDDAQFRHSLQFALKNFVYQDRPIQLLTASSSQEGALVFARETDIAVAMLDVVMETDDAGLRLVRNVREILGNTETRIAMVTGQPGMAPLQTVVTDYDIDDYWLKTDFTAERLRGMLTTRLREWQRLRAINQARRGLQMIVEGCNAFADARTVADFSTRVVMELTRLLGVKEEGVVCVTEDRRGSPYDACIIAAAGAFASAQGKPLSSLANAAVRDALADCLIQRRDLTLPHGLTLYLASQLDALSCAVYVEGVESLDETQQNLLRVFASHINSALVNVSLISRLDRMAYCDSLLDLPNRNALMRFLDSVMQKTADSGHSLVLLDIDDFSGISFVLGFEHGDELLRELSRRMQAQFPPPAVTARLHDDVFAVLGPSDMITEERLATLSLTGVDGLPGRFISLGAARLDLAEFHGSAQEAMAMTSMILKSAKQAGYGQFRGYEFRMSGETKRRLAISEALHLALDSGGLSIALQPQVRPADGVLVSAEVLARWTLPDGTVIAPSEFICVAEANGEIVRLGAQVFQQTVDACCQLSRLGLSQIRLAVNVSVLQLVQSGLLRGWLADLAAAGVSARNIEIEVTESVAMQGEIGILERLKAFHEVGFSVAIDDFGTGYSSLARLREMPIDVLKIDRSFINEIGGDGDGAIAETVMDMAHRLGLLVVAEGVETEQQAAWLKTRKCGLVQGYHFARPMPLEEFINFARRH